MERPEIQSDPSVEINNNSNNSKTQDPESDVQDQTSVDVNDLPEDETEDYQVVISDPQTTSNGGNESDDLFYMDETARFFAEVSDAFPLRKLFEFLKGFHGKGNLRCSADRIRFEEISTIGDTPNSVLNQLEIETCEFTEYDFSSRHPEILVGIHLGDIYGIMRTIRKRDGVRIFKHANDHSLYIQIIKHDVPANHQGNVSMIRPQSVDLIQCTPPNYDNNERNPNFTIPASTFTKTCSDISSVKCEKVTIHSYRRWALFKATRPGNITGRVERMGNFDDQVRPVSPTEYGPTEMISNPSGPRPRLILKSGPQTEDFVLTVRKETIKALSKLNNLSPSSSIKVYLEKGLPMKLVTRVGSYGVLRVYIRSIDS